MKRRKKWKKMKIKEIKIKIEFKDKREKQNDKSMKIMHERLDARIYLSPIPFL